MHCSNKRVAYGSKRHALDGTERLGALGSERQAAYGCEKQVAHISKIVMKASNRQHSAGRDWQHTLARDTWASKHCIEKVHKARKHAIAHMLITLG